MLESRFPDLALYLFLDRIAAMRDGKANGSADTARAAVELLATRKILAPARETQLCR